MSVSINDLKFPYIADIPEPLKDIAEAPSIQRLRQIGMNCGCEYTSFPVFQRPGSYHRFDHSLGVALIVWRFTHDLRQAAAGLLHDIATPVFAHVVDFFRGDYLKQEETEAGTLDCIKSDSRLMDTLTRWHLTVDDVCDYHRYPIADNDSPRLSADRLEYTLGNILHYGFGTRDCVAEILNDLTVITAEDGQPEIGFIHRDTAVCFANLALRCSRLYVSPEDRYSMQRLAEIIRLAFQNKVLTQDMLYLTEPEVIDRFLRDPDTSSEWLSFTRLHAVSLSDHPIEGHRSRQISAKKRCIDPLIKGLGRVTSVDPDYREMMSAFMNEPQTCWISET